MTTALKSQPMARRKDSSEKPPSTEPINVTVERSLHRKLKVLAAAKGLDLVAYMDEVLRAHVEHEWPKFLREQS
jgi:predicted HicB family RNase H-like nuclease